MHTTTVGLWVDDTVCESPTGSRYFTWLDAYVNLFVVCKKMVLDMMSVEQLLDVFGVCYELHRPQGRALGYTAVKHNWDRSISTS